MLAIHGLLFGVLVQETNRVWSLSGEEQDLSESTRAMGMDGEKLPMNKLICRAEGESLQAAELGD